jgi:rubrerythrin
MLGEKTKKNLEEAFAGESMARNKYDYWAKTARKNGYVQIANIFTETALNEKEHAKLWAKKLGIVSDDTTKDLSEAIKGEVYEYSDMYQRMASEAKEEGHDDIAELFTQVAKSEEAHANRYKKLLENIEKDQVFKKSEAKKWKCNNCGYVHETSENAPMICPSCLHPQAHFEVFVENY